MKRGKINILFVCRYNRFRSRIAEVYFKKINKNKNIQIKSAGLFKGMPLNPKTVNIAKKFGLEIKGKVKGLSSRIMIWQDITVVVADDVPPKVFKKNKRYGKKVIIWKIKDADYLSIESIGKVIKKIMKKADRLNERLNK